eukprot:172197-Lingulodinium_polyedra.AAC.1
MVLFADAFPEVAARQQIDTARFDATKPELVVGTPAANFHALTAARAARRRDARVALWAALPRTP